VSIIDDQRENTNFSVKGYKDYKEGCHIYYFKHENEYKFIVSKEDLTVYVNESVYTFNTTKKTEAIINASGYTFKAYINTNKLVISDTLIHIEYELDFNSFKGKYEINLELQ
jgi:hypothetical protein